VNIEILPEDECLRLLRSRELGRLVFVHEFNPVVLPMNYVLDGRDVVFRADLGIKTRAATYRFRTAFQVDSIDVRRRSGWDVLVQGRLEEVSPSERPDEYARLWALGVEPWAPGAKTHVLRLVTEHVSGRRLHGRGEGDAGAPEEVRR